MKSIIEEFYHGNFEPVGRKFSKDSEAVYALRKLNTVTEEFLKLLNEKQQEMFEEVTEAHVHYHSLTERTMFADGFRYGAKFTYDAFLGDNNG